MAIGEEARHRIYQKLEGLLGPADTAALMGALPTSDVATKADLDHLAAVTRRDIEQATTTTGHHIDQLRAETRHELGQLRSDMGQLEERMALRIDKAGSDVVGQLRAEITTALVSQTRITLLTMLGAVVGTGSLVLAGGRLL